MYVTIEKLTTEALMQRACASTLQPGATSRLSLKKIYQCRHSPIRTQLFWVELHDVPTFVSVHFVRHTVGVTHFVRSNREDRGGNGEANRHTPLHHAMLLNAETLLNMAEKRLCFNAHMATVGAMCRIRSAVERVDPDLAALMAPPCVQRGYCPELKPCKAGPVAVIRANRNSWHTQQRDALNKMENAHE